MTEQNKIEIDIETLRRLVKALAYTKATLKAITEDIKSVERTLGDVYEEITKALKEFENTKAFEELKKYIKEND